MKKLQSLIKKRSDALAEQARLKAKDIALAAEEKAALESGSLDDPAVFKTISDVRLMRELIPRKLKQLDDSIDAIDAQLPDELRAFKAEQFPIIEEDIKRLLGELRTSLKPFAPAPEFFNCVEQNLNFLPEGLRLLRYKAAVLESSVAFGGAAPMVAKFLLAHDEHAVGEKLFTAKP